MARGPHAAREHFVCAGHFTKS